MADIQNMELFQKIGENERELALLRGDLNDANQRNEDLRAELKLVKAERDRLQKGMELFQKMGESEHELALLRDDLKNANARIEVLSAENRKLKAELEEKHSTAIVNTAARSDLDEKLKMSIFQNRQLQEENEYLKKKIDRLEADQPMTAHMKSAAPQNDDNPFEYHVPYLKSVLYKDEYFPNHMRFEDYDFGFIKVGEVACLRGHIILFDKGDQFQFSGGDLYSISLVSRNYKYVSIDKKSENVIVEYDAVTSDGGKMYRKTMSVPITVCLNAEEVVRWRGDYMKYQVRQEQKDNKEQPVRRGFFKRR